MDTKAAARAARRGGVVRAEKSGKARVVRTRARWSQAAERRFLETLAATANVSAAAEAAGFSTTALYKRRLRWPGFAEEWRRALDHGYALLEDMLLERATDSLRCAPVAAAGAPPAMTVAEATNLLRLHRAAVRGGPAQAYGWRQAVPDIEEVRASILRKIEAIERSEARREAREAAAAARAAAGAAGDGSAGDGSTRDDAR